MITALMRLPKTALGDFPNACIIPHDRIMDLNPKNQVDFSSWKSEEQMTFTIGTDIVNGSISFGMGSFCAFIRYSG